jgi:predicted O-methyltransferase YrrM
MPINNLKISRQNFSNLFWRTIFLNGAFVIERIKLEIIEQSDYFESLRKTAEYNTGSISLASSVCLALLTHYFKPNTVAEVGTFIGRSTFSLALGAQVNGNQLTNIYTCDYSNNIQLNFNKFDFNIFQHPKQSSTEMFSKIYNGNIKPDMYLLDGRLQPEDIKIISDLQIENALILLDDFEGTEKGVVNTFVLTENFKNNFIVAYPPAQSFLREYGLMDSCTTAVMVPMTRLEFVNQA